eukprot:CAMPEP_0203839338 /NCGR_PEP_ID=MMETSP0359-20131031/115_1 /ASSEMBLY_ACC=CAM_ASM_000338 /TAXON_ID=268821 /ORGANISM="Scrippsiella Hangoei, Strain SHTV-5" /LENGTH=235 /DNA_ID=CAMNT_0050753353 /DNA_START=129 /DNA_END=833 /DNA_ORIENTATION=-
MLPSTATTTTGSGTTASTLLGLLAVDVEPIVEVLPVGYLASKLQQLTGAAQWTTHLFGLLAAAGAVEEPIVEALLVEVVLASHLSKQLTVDLRLQTDGADVLAALPGRSCERRESLFDAHVPRPRQGATFVAFPDGPNQQAHHSRPRTEHEQHLPGERLRKPDDERHHENHPTLKAQLNKTNQLLLSSVDGDCGRAPGSEALSMPEGGGPAPGSEALSMSGGGGPAPGSEVLSMS